MDIATLVCPVCPHCGVENVAFQLVGQYHEEFSYKAYQLWVCGSCELPACSISSATLSGAGHNLHELSGFFPVPESVSAPYGVPENIANVFRSAKRYLQQGRDADYEGACIMARRGIELAVNELGAEGKNLFQKIENLEAKRLIPPAMRDWAHHLREIGNEGAHGNAASQNDAMQAVYFAEMLFTYLYSLPRKMAEYRQNP